MEYDHTGRGGKVKLIRVFLLLVMAVCLFRIGEAQYLSVENEKQQGELSEAREVHGTNDANQMAVMDESEIVGVWREVSGAETESAGIEKETEGSETETTKTEKETEGIETENHPVILDKYAALYEQNSDLAGWLSIDGMVIDYPVMQCGDDEYYLHHDYYGNDSKYGCLYVRGSADVNTPGTNFIIYGHNMKDGSMFGDLDLYKEESFFREHSLISFDTLYEERTYEVVSVFLSQVYKEDEDVFKYYRFYQADTQEEFDNFYDNIKEMSLYDTGVTAEFGDTFLTLSTCAYHVTDGRLVVVAKRIHT